MSAADWTTAKRRSPIISTDVIFTHAPFPTVMHNGVLVQLNQNGNREDTLDQVVPVANNVMFTLALTASDFTRHST